MIKTIIVEDDPNDVKALVDSLSRYEEIEILCICKNSTEGLASIVKYHPELIFLDIEMPGMSGVEFLESLDSSVLNKCRIVVYTAYKHYAVEAFRKHAFDMLLKPIDPDDLRGIIERFMDSWRAPADNEEGVIARAEKDLLMYLNNMDFQVFKLRDIVIFRYDNDKKRWQIIIANHHEPIPMKHSVSSIDILKLSNQFVQVHKKFIINIYYLQSVRDNICNFYPPFEDIKGVKISFKYRKHLLEKFSNL